MVDDSLARFQAALEPTAAAMIVAALIGVRFVLINLEVDPLYAWRGPRTRCE